MTGLRDGTHGLRTGSCTAELRRDDHPIDYSIECLSHASNPMLCRRKGEEAFGGAHGTLGYGGWGHAGVCWIVNAISIYSIPPWQTCWCQFDTNSAGVRRVSIELQQHSKGIYSAASGLGTARVGGI